jgi:hypothetical protein
MSARPTIRTTARTNRAPEPTDHSVVRSVDFEVRMSITNIHHVMDDVLADALQQYIASAPDHLFDGHGEVTYTIHIKHHADHLIRQYNPTPF